MSIFGYVYAWCVSGVNKVTDDFGAEINRAILFGYSAPRQQQSTEGAPTPNIGRGAETEDNDALSHGYDQDTIPSTAGLQV